MREKAIERINAEMQKRADDTYVEIIGHYIINRIEQGEGIAKIAEGKKTLRGAMNAVREKAKKRRQGNTAVLTPPETFGAVDRYFGFPEDQDAQMRALWGDGAAPKAPKAPKAAPDIIRLEDFL